MPSSLMITTCFTKIGGGGGVGFGFAIATGGGAGAGAGGGGVPRHPIAATTTHAQRFTKRD